ncbi:MAG: glycerol-3-phosphate acyltransferase [candidate division KSB1 bacterium]|nr:glycerol-3-phosphate acyltransferase [candidate division KSB1 bacterium]MDZ7336325.1 glycerol-3-phosphate acyltransferase [candidate division KSB1 bacterium]MDZ7358812.1 glycerol-3-phosphate acyltransferase [candidate division KSB1 bacterium]MDZ7375256.1 glycerol-3-phosphate acyltransferase [candidate division KSB1 bacterium]MDZ7402383.1 glycerol-3-phosphate acyltransferase [candidate division KSB1 bacterium]
MICLISIALGYLFGSLLPAYYFGRLAGVDIRNEGAKYAGTINVYHVVGKKAAVATALFDLSKGLVAIHTALAFGVDFHCAQLSGLAAIAGHVLPFYLNFRGGQGVACATGMLLYYLLHYLLAGILQYNALLFLAVIVIMFAYVARHGEVISAIILPLLCFIILTRAPEDQFNFYFVAIALYIVGVGIYNIIHRKLLIIEDPIFRRHWWRVALRPLAIIFVLFYWFSSKSATLWLIGSLALVFLGMDLIRLRSRSINENLMTKVEPLFKKKEQHHFSSMSLFLTSAFLTILLFDKIIAITSISFLIFGDLFSKIFGLAYGKQRLWDKTLEGSLAFFAVSLIASYLIAWATAAPLLLLLFGALVASIVELLPSSIDDNFTVALISAIAMTVVQKLFFI